MDISRNISGGALGGLLDFRSEQLDPAHNALGRIAVALSDVVNAQHHEGIDLSGALGGDFFAVGGAEVLDNALNTGTGTVAATRANVGALTGRDYMLEMTGSGWQLRDSLSGAAVPMTGTGTAADPFVADGLEIEVGGAADVGDTFLIRPTRGCDREHGRTDLRSLARRGRGADPHGCRHAEIPAPARSRPVKCSTARTRSCALRSRSSS